ncbi:hypothetical protein ACFFX0_18005 [Citricoccus parietis]|uniref:Uncharacterized protein n=1 Tax=Citricoccus parietis TaxID=592307 RepID=A0ABV5G241_9MICC
MEAGLFRTRPIARKLAPARRRSAMVSRSLSVRKRGCSSASSTDKAGTATSVVMPVL